MASSPRSGGVGDCRKVGEGFLGVGVLLSPAEAVSERAHQQGCDRWAVVISGSGTFPDVAVGVLDLFADSAEDAEHVGFAVGAVVGERLAGPLPGDQHPPADEAERFPAVGFAGTPTGNQTGFRVPGLDAVEQPVRAPFRARFVAKRGGEPVDVRFLSVGLRRPTWRRLSNST